MIRLFILSYYFLFINRFMSNREVGGWAKRTYDATAFTMHKLFPLMRLCRKDPICRGIWNAHLQYFFRLF